MSFISIPLSLALISPTFLPPQHEFAPLFLPLRCLTFLHLNCTTKRRPKENLMTEKEHLTQTEIWNSAARSVAVELPTLDFLGWHGEHYVIARNLPFPAPSSNATATASWTVMPAEDGVIKAGRSNSGVCLAEPGAGSVELKELPARKRLDCGKGVDLGSENAEWLERKDVPMDYEMPGLE